MTKVARFRIMKSFSWLLFCDPSFLLSFHPIPVDLISSLSFKLAYATFFLKFKIAEALRNSFFAEKEIIESRKET